MSKPTPFQFQAIFVPQPPRALCESPHCDSLISDTGAIAAINRCARSGAFDHERPCDRAIADAASGRRIKHD